MFSYNNIIIVYSISIIYNRMEIFTILQLNKKKKNEIIKVIRTRSREWPLRSALSLL